MDDKRLQSEFDGYFEGAELPQNLTADAKAQVKPRKGQVGKWFLRLAPVAAAIVVVIAMSVVFANKFSLVNGNNGVADNESPAPSAQYQYYTTDGLTGKYMDPYLAKDVKGLKFAANFEYMDNSNINLTAFYDNNTLVLAEAEISLLYNGYRHDATVYVEYTDEYYCYEDLKEYHTGEDRYYGSIEYVYNLTDADGEPCHMIYFYRGGVKYYLCVTTSAPDGYEVFLNFLKNN